jgi:excisionase family DNA binding protein|tara:strand:+ start:1052 stop:1318 length:267 start_codon:yes stop_codon:yes gene_type:complete
MTVDTLIQSTIEKVFKNQFNEFEKRLLKKLKPDNLLTVYECALIAKVSSQTIKNKIRNNQLKASIVGNAYRVLESELQTYINRNNEKR